MTWFVMNGKRRGQRMSDFGFGFDIDGVIRFGKSVIAPGAAETLRGLREPVDGGVSVPYVFITNAHGTGQGMCQAFGEQLGYEIDPADLITGVTPLPEVMPEKLFHEPVLIVSNDYVFIQVCELFHFDNPIWIEDVVKRVPGIVPHRDWTKIYSDDVEPLRVSSILLCNESGCLQTTLQICLDALLQNGNLTPRKDGTDIPHKGIPEQLPVFSVNPDFWYSSSYPAPRLTLGSMALCLNAVYKEAIKLRYGVEQPQELKITTIGKPTRPTFIFSKKRLEKIAGRPLKRIYMLGDSLFSDILGANNAHDLGFISVLVQADTMPPGQLEKIHPDYIFHNIKEAVEEILEMELNKK